MSKFRNALIMAASASILGGACGDDVSSEVPDAGTADAGSADAVPADASMAIDAGDAVDPLAGMGEVEVMVEGRMFTEGPVWLPEEGVLLFTDIPANIIYEMDAEGSLTERRNPSNNANGLLLDNDGLLLAAEHGTRRVTRTLAGGDVVAIAEQYQGNQLNSPNDLEIRSDGTIYFTDPPYGIGNDPDRSELGFMGVFRIPPGGGLVAEWMGSPETRPNGVVLSPDEQWLYVDDSEAGQVRRFSVAQDGSLTLDDDEFITGLPGGDGMAVDSAGNLYISTSEDIHVYSPEGTLWGKIEIPGDYTTNCAFGGADRRTLYVTGNDKVFQVALTIPGLP